MKNRKFNMILGLLALVLCCLVNTFTTKTVSAAPKISKKNVVISVNEKYTLKMTGVGKNKVTWSSGNKKIVTVTSKGIILGKKAGNTKIVAKVGKKTYNCTVKVENPTTAKTVYLTKGKTKTLKVTGTTRKATFTTANSKIAKVDKNGKITAVAKGETTIKSKIGGKTLTTKVYVETPSISLSASSVCIGKKVTAKVNGTARGVTYSTSNSTIAMVTSKGVITARKAGSVTIYAKLNDITLSMKLTVKAESISIPNPTPTPTPNVSYEVPDEIQCDMGVETRTALKLNLSNPIYYSTENDILTVRLEYALADEGVILIITGEVPGTTYINLRCGTYYKRIKITVTGKALQGFTTTVDNYQIEVYPYLYYSSFSRQYKIKLFTKTTNTTGLQKYDVSQMYMKYRFYDKDGNTVISNNNYDLSYQRMRLYPQKEKDSVKITTDVISLKEETAHSIVGAELVEPIKYGLIKNDNNGGITDYVLEVSPSVSEEFNVYVDGLKSNTSADNGLKLESQITIYPKDGRSSKTLYIKYSTLDENGNVISSSYEHTVRFSNSFIQTHKSSSITNLFPTKDGVISNILIEVYTK